MNLPGYRLLIPMLLLVTGLADAQQTRDNAASATESVQSQVDRLAEMVNREQAALESSQRQIEELRHQVAELQGQLVGTRQAPQQTQDEAVARLNAEVENIREQQQVQQSEIATHQQDKVESASKFPVKLTGLILMNTFVNTAAVDIPQSPTWRLAQVERPAFPCARPCLDSTHVGPMSSEPARMRTCGSTSSEVLARRRLLAKWWSRTIAHGPC